MTLAYEYPEAGKRAPIGVRAAIRAWHAFAPAWMKERQPLLYWVLGSGTSPYKMTPEESAYTDASTVDSQECANCYSAYKHVVYEDKFICSQIQGSIKPKGWCRLWNE